MNCDRCGKEMLRITKDGKTVSHYYCIICGHQRGVEEKNE